MFHRHQTEAVPDSTISLVQLTPALNHCTAPIAGQSWCHSRANYKEAWSQGEGMASLKCTPLPGPSAQAPGSWDLVFRRRAWSSEAGNPSQSSERGSVQSVYLLCNLYLAVTLYCVPSIAGNLPSDLVQRDSAAGSHANTTQPPPVSVSHEWAPLGAINNTAPPSSPWGL